MRVKGPVWGGEAAVVLTADACCCCVQTDFLWGQLNALQQFYDDRCVFDFLLLAGGRAAGPCWCLLPVSTSALFCVRSPHGCRLALAREAGEDEPSAPFLAPLPSSSGGGSEEPQQLGATEVQQQESAGDGDGHQQLQQRHVSALVSLDASIGRLWEAAPVGTLVVVVTGQGDTGYSRCGG